MGMTTRGERALAFFARLTSTPADSNIGFRMAVVGFIFSATSV